MKISKSELRYLRSLSQKKIRQTERKFILEGWRSIKEVLHSPAKVDFVAVLPRFLEDQDYRRILDGLEERGIATKEIDEVQLKQVADTVHAQGVVAVVHQRSSELERLSLEHASLVVAADAVGDPGNMGTIIRSSDWFGVDALLLGEGCVELHNEKVVRSTVGSLFHLPIVDGVNLASGFQLLRKLGFSVIGFSGEGKIDYSSRNHSRKEVFVFGSEAHGMSREVRSHVDEIVRIPRFGKAESLNVGVACGIVLAHARFQQKQKGS